ncbi:MAG: hypothetical protein M3077_08810 [Candidatus Dormibacteraeota bacterium]|nr:hypothetical protein [Candidatus Dormibacteraeota bacterium]
MPANQLHAALGARFTRRDGWEIPAAYGPLEDERAAIREGVAIADVTPRGKIDLRGRVDEMLGRMTSDADVRVAQVSAQWALLFTRPGALARWLPLAEEAAGSSGMATDATSIYSGIALLGPKTSEVLERLTAMDVSSVSRGGATGLRLAGIPAILTVGERATEVYAGSEYGRYLWRTVAQVATQLGGRAVGWDALTAEGWS